MKLIIAIFILVAAIVFTSCNNEKKQKPFEKRERVYALTISPDSSKFLNDFMTRISAGNYLYDSTKGDVVWKKDTVYDVPVQGFVDTITQKAYLDSAVNRKRSVVTFLQNKSLVRSLWENTDSALKYLEQFIKTPKVDTTKK